ncbi:MAG: YfhO family protein [Myxococcales bacterium]
MLEPSPDGDLKVQPALSRPPIRCREAMVVAAVALAVAAAFYAPVLAGTDRLLYRDTGRMHAPVKEFLGAELRAGRFPAWNPFLGLGMPVVPSAVDAALHPFTLLAVALPIHSAVSAWVLLSHVLAVIGMWLWARRLGAGPGAALAAGLGFGFTGHLVSSTDNLQYLTALGALPLLFATLHRLLEDGLTPARIGAMGAASFLCAAAGDPQAWGIALVSMPFYALAIGPKEVERSLRLRRAMAALAACVVGALPVLMPLALWLPESSRAALKASDRELWNLSPWRLLELVVPYLARDRMGVQVSPLYGAFFESLDPIPWVASVYLGVTVFALGLTAALGDRRAAWLAAGAVVLLWAAMGSRSGFGQLAAQVPVLRSLRFWEKLAVWPALLASAAAAIGIQRVEEDRPRARRLAIAAACAAMACVGSWALAPRLAAAWPARGGSAVPEVLVAQLEGNLADGFLHAGLLLLALSAVTFAASRGSLRKTGAVLAVLVALDVCGANVRAYFLDSAEVDRPTGVLAEELRRQPGLQRVVTPFEPYVGYQGLTQSESSNLVGSLSLGAAWNVSQRIGNFDYYTGAVPRRLYEVNESLAPSRLLPNVGLWDVGHAVVPASREASAGVGVPRDAPVEALEPKVGALLVAVRHRPRAYVAGRVESRSPEQALAFALDPGSVGGDLTVVEANVPAGAETGRGAVRVVSEEPAEIALEATAEGPALVVLNDAYAPGWSAEVDRREATIVAANYLVRGVFVDAGTHEIVFRYSTPGLTAGLLVLVAGVAGLLAWAALARRRRAA